MKKNPQNTLGSEKMWFNVLKNDQRMSAYNDFLNALGLGGDIETLNPSVLQNPEVRVDDMGGIHATIETARRRYIFINSPEEPIHLESPAPYQDYEVFVFNLFREEYPEAWTQLRKLLYGAVTDKRGSDIKEKPATEEYEKTIKKIMEDWGVYMDTINSFILLNVENTETNIPDPTYRTNLESDINTNINYERVKLFTGLYQKEKDDIISAILRGIRQTYAVRLRSKNTDIVWENFIKFTIHFMYEYIEHINQTAINLSITKEEAVQRVTKVDLVTFARDIWWDNSNDVETLMRQLPNY